MPSASLAMIFTPSFFRGPPVSKTFNTSPSGTHETISKVFHEARIEQQFMLNLLECLDVTRLEDEDDWIPTHGKHNSLSSSLSSSASSVFPVNTSPPFYVPEITGSDGDARPSLESTASTVSLASHTSFGSTKRKHRSKRFRTQTVEPQAEQASSMPTSASFPLRSRAITDSVMLHGKSQSSKDLTAGMFSDIGAAPLPPLPDLPFVKPVIVVNEAD